MKNFNILSKARWLVTIILLTALGSGNVWGVEYEYIMITDPSEVTAGTYVVGALRSESATNNFYFGKATVSSGDWVVSDGYVTVAAVNGVRKFDASSLPSGAVEFTFTGNNTDGFTIANGSNYLYYTENSSRKLAFASTGSTYTWTVASKSSPLIVGGVVLKKKSGGAASNYTISENATSTTAIRGYSTTTQYRAIYLFKKQEKIAGDYVLVENAGDIGPGQYLIVYNNTNALNTHYGAVNTNTYGTYTDISSFYNNKKIESNATTDALAYIVTATTHGYSIKRGEFLGNSSNSTGSYLRWDNTFTANQNEWTLGVNSIVSARNSNYAIRWNNNSGDYRFAIYGPTGQQAVQLFKKGEAPSCDAPTAVTKGSFNRTNQEMEIGWTGATNVDICYSKSTTKPASPQVTNTSTNPYAIDVSDYSATDKCYVWVRQNCGGGETSDWVAINVSGNAYFNLPSHTLTITPSPAGSGTFTKSPNVTNVVEGRTVSITANPATGYVFSSWAVSGTNASISSTSTNPTTFSMGTADATVTATFTAKPITGWNWTYKSAAIPAVVELYLNEIAQFDVTYSPADLLSDQKGYDATYTNPPLAQDAKATAYYKVHGNTVSESTTLTLTSTANTDFEKVITLRIKALPVVHFVDIVHSIAGGDVAATVTTGIVTLEKNAPIHADFDETGANDCETAHTKLIGWIDSEWADANPDATHSEIVAATEYLLSPGESINTETLNGKTYYAVWAKLE